MEGAEILLTRIILALAVAAIVVLPAAAQRSFTGSGDFSGTAVLWFSGTNVTAKFTGNLSITGSVTIDGERVRFTAKGSTHGSGEGDTSTMEGIAWGVFILTGRTETGEAIEIRGGITGDAGSFTLSSDMTAGAGSAEFFALIITGGKKIEAAGQVRGEAAGGFVPPNDPYTMQVEGTGTMEFHTSSAVPAGDPTTIAKRLPWKLSTWPADVRAEFLSLVGLEPQD